MTASLQPTLSEITSNIGDKLKPIVDVYVRTEDDLPPRVNGDEVNLVTGTHYIFDPVFSSDIVYKTTGGIWITTSLGVSGAIICTNTTKPMFSGDLVDGPVTLKDGVAVCPFTECLNFTNTTNNPNGFLLLQTFIISGTTKLGTANNVALFFRENIFADFGGPLELIDCPSFGIRFVTFQPVQTGTYNCIDFTGNIPDVIIVSITLVLGAGQYFMGFLPLFTIGSITGTSIRSVTGLGGVFDPASGVDQDTIGMSFSNNKPSLRSTRARYSGYFKNNVLITDAGAQVNPDDALIVNALWTAVDNKRFTFSSSGIATYLDNSPITLILDIGFSADVESGNDTVWEFIFSKNGILQDNFTKRITVSTGIIVSNNMHIELDIEQNDNIALYVKDITFASGPAGNHRLIVGSGSIFGGEI
jgi:hypothetical protein